MKDKHRFYLNIALQMASASYCERSKVGALLEKDGNIVAFGYNGTPHGFDNTCEIDKDTTKPEVLHAESNAITKCARSAHSSDGTILYVTTGPCFECAKLIIQAGIKAVYYVHPYRKDDGIRLLEQANIHTQRIDL